MIGISVAESNEWETTLKYFNKSHDDCEKFPFGEYFKTTINTPFKQKIPMNVRTIYGGTTLLHRYSYALKSLTQICEF